MPQGQWWWSCNVRVKGKRCGRGGDAVSDRDGKDCLQLHIAVEHPGEKFNNGSVVKRSKGGK